jgi:hypothetical protein
MNRARKSTKNFKAAKNSAILKSVEQLLADGQSGPTSTNGHDSGSEAHLMMAHQEDNKIMNVVEESVRNYAHAGRGVDWKKVAEDAKKAGIRNKYGQPFSPNGIRLKWYALARAHKRPHPKSDIPKIEIPPEELEKRAKKTLTTIEAVLGLEADAQVKLEMIGSLLRKWPG